METQNQLSDNPEAIFKELDDRITHFYTGPNQKEPVFANSLEGDLLAMYYRARCLQKTVNK